ncbi:metaxin-2-like isoform X2 [Hylaeus anthracinus]|uniref:metaxin-2-like isoform X2 n=1 Tax=Hylaeus volcanicus TaxID=313075 RepID=UPI0023B797C3|nr:metaxin-2-like isoform X2 [Hylaeus volcanicus]XP_053996239.1 metaxin-2-like isoform X2 [Hylaeus anthracinus]
MPNALLNDSRNLELEAQEPWPQTITLFQPYEVEQILLPDSANCLAVQAYLKMCGLEFQIELRSNAEYMSPSGNKGISLSDHLSPIGKADMRAYISLVNNIFVNAELYICWIDEITLNEVTKPRHGSVYPWPLNHFLNWQKRKEIIKKLKVHGWYNKNLEDVCSEIKKCCGALSERLKGNEYFSGKKPNEVDALVFGHVYKLINSNLGPTIEEIAATIKQFPTLIDHMKKVKYNYFQFDLAESVEDFEVINNPSKDTLWNCSESIETLPTLSEDSFIKLLSL